MNKPAHQGVYADRHIDCQFAMEDHFLELMEAAQQAGWTTEDAATAIIASADNYVLKDRECEKLSQVLADLRSGRSG